MTDPRLIDLSGIPDEVDWVIGKTNGGMTIHAKLGHGEDHFADTPQEALELASAHFRAEHPQFDHIPIPPSPLRDRSAWAAVVADTRHESGPSSVMSEVEMESLSRAGRDAGGYLSNIGKTDMAQLSKAEWQKLTSLIVLGFELHLAGLQSGESA